MRLVGTGWTWKLLHRQRHWNALLAGRSKPTPSTCAPLRGPWQLALPPASTRAHREVQAVGPCVAAECRWGSVITALAKGVASRPAIPHHPAPAASKRLQQRRPLTALHKLPHRGLRHSRGSSPCRLGNNACGGGSRALSCASKRGCRQHPAPFPGCPKPRNYRTWQR